MRYDKFTQKAQEALATAQEILDEYNHQELDTEHIFLALLRQEDGLVGKILQRIDIVPDVVLAEYSFLLTPFIEVTCPNDPFRRLILAEISHFNSHSASIYNLLINTN